jgi:hypothetical protein
MFALVFTIGLPVVVAFAYLGWVAALVVLVAACVGSYALFAAGWMD